MGLLTWFFPTEQSRLESIRKLMAAGRFDKARAIAARVKAAEGETLYDECSKHLEKSDRDKFKLELEKQGFHGWKVEVGQVGARRRAELERLIGEELEKAGVDLGLPDVDPKPFQAAVAKAQRRARSGGNAAGTVRLVRVSG